MTKILKPSVGLAAILGLIVAGCADDKPLNTFEPEGPKAQNIYDLMTPLVWAIMAIVWVLVWGMVAIAVWRGKAKPGDDLDDLPNQTHGNTKLELFWTFVPLLVLAALTVPTVSSIWALEEQNEPDELDVMVIGQQWWWEYRYDIDGDGFFIDGNSDGKVDELDQQLPMHLVLDPDDVVTANELVMPVGEQVDLIIGSRDVIHSFWIPRLNGKRDATPGRWHTWSLEADRTGKFTGWCTEFCGLSHARMRMSTVVLEQDQFETWLAKQAKPASIPTDAEALAGRDVFINQCSGCHVVNEKSSNPSVIANEYTANFEADLDAKAAPDLTHFASRSTFAGGTYGVYNGLTGDPNDDELPSEIYLNLAELARKSDSGVKYNRAELKRWVRDAPSRKDMDPDDRQGMLAFPQLTEEELDQVVTYLETLK